MSGGNLLEEARKLAEEAKRKQGAKLQRHRADATSTEDAYQQRMADGIIKDLAARIKRAAGEGKDELEVMKLDSHTHPHFHGDASKLMEQVDLYGLTEDNLLGAAWTVTKWLQENGMDVRLETRDENDAGQSRSWTDVVLVASWA